MTDDLDIFIPGTPAGWRQQAAGLQHSRLADPAKRWRSKAIPLLRYAWGAREPLAGPVSLRVRAIFPRPGRLDCEHSSRPRRCLCTEEQIDGRAVPHVGVPDLTNVLKLAEDAANKAGVLTDDRIVGGLVASKRYAARGEPCGVHITITITEGVEP